MLNLRQINNTDNTKTNSDAQHFSRFSIDFRVPSSLLGNIGEPLDHSQSERIHEDDPGEHEVTAERSEAGTGADLESAWPVAEPSQAEALREDESRARASTAGAAANPSVTCWDDSKRACKESTAPDAVTSGTQGDEVGDASHALDYVDTGEEVRLSLCLYCCNLKLRIISFVGAGGQR